MIEPGASADLSGEWRIHPADDDLRRVFAAPEHDDAAWTRTTVPGHWRTVAGLADADGPFLYRRALRSGAPPEGARTFLELDGVFYQGDVFFDGHYLGDTEGYFVQHVFDITEHLGAPDTRDDSEHVIALEVACAPQRRRRSKRNLTGVFQHWDAIAPEWNPGGIWRPARLRTTGPVRIDRFRVACVEAGEERAVLALRVMLDAAAPGKVTLRLAVDDAGRVLTEHEQELTLAAGRNRAEWRVTVPRPPLWWPHALGAPNLVHLRLDCVDAGATQPSDTRTVRTGLRQVQADDWVYRVNGEKLFLKGANQGPQRMAIAELTADEARADLQLARDAGLDLVRLHAHITHPAVYEAADELGMLLWQDLPLQWGYDRGVRKQAVRQAREAVDLLGRHPSIVHWCAHNEPLALNVDSDGFGSMKKAAQMKLQYGTLQMLPTWNKTFLDLSLHRALVKADPSRPVSPHSGVLPGPFSGGTDTHLYFGWYHGSERDLPKWLARVPRVARFLSEFGAQAVPDDTPYVDESAWPDLDWDALGYHHNVQKAFFDRYVPPAAHATFASWRDATQAYQAELLRRHVEELRRIKYRPAGGFTMFAFADARDHHGITWSVLDADRTPKAGLAALAAACRPVIVVADRLPAAVWPGMQLSLDVHVVNDTRRPLVGATVHAVLAIGARTWSWEFQGDAGPDTVVRVGTLALTVAPDASLPDATLPDATLPDMSGDMSDPSEGAVSLTLHLAHPTVQAMNRYAGRLVTAPA